MIVVDASALIGVLLQDPAAIAAEQRLLSSGESLHAPHLIDVEVLHTLRRYVLANEISPRRAQELLDDFHDFTIDRHQHGYLVPRAWELRANISAYGAMYVALAELLGTTLLTRDRRIANASGHHARIELI